MVYSQQRSPRIDLAQYDEPKLCEIVEWVLRDDFEIRREVWGVYMVDGETRLRIDRLLFPKSHLLNAGFIPAWIGLEVKSPLSKSVSGFDFAWQTVSYAQSTFDGQRPPFVLMFPSVRWFWPNGSTARDLQALLQYANVGQLELGYTRDTAKEWRMAFGPAPYFTKRDGLGSQPNGALKRRVGNSK